MKTSLEDLKRKSVRGGAATSVAQAVSISLQLVSTVVLARLLTPDDYGVIAMVMAVTAFAGLFRDLGLSAAAIRNSGITQAQQSSLFWLNTAAGAGLTLLVAAVSPLIAAFYGKPELTMVTCALSSTFLLGSLGAQSGAVLIREMRFVANGAASVAGALVSLVLSIWLSFAGLGYWALVWGNVAGTMATTAVLFLAARFRPLAPWKGENVSEMLKFGSHVTAFDVVNYFHRNLDNVLIGRVWGAEALGLYSRAYTLLLFPINAIRQPITSVAFPAMSKLQSDPEAFRAYYVTTVKLVALLGMPITGFLLAHSDLVVLLALGQQWTAASPLFSALSAAALIQPTASLIGLVSLSLGRSRRYLAVGLLHAVVVSAGFVLGVGYGALGVAISYAISNWITLLPVLALTFAGTNLRLRDYFNGISHAVYMTAAAIAVSMLIRHFGATSGDNALNALVAVVTYGATIAISVWFSQSCRALISSFFRYFNRRAVT